MDGMNHIPRSGTRKVGPEEEQGEDTSTDSHGQQHRSNEVAVRLDAAGLSLKVPKGTSIAEAVGRLHLALRLDCGGKGLCAQCRVVAEPSSNLSPLTESELDVLSPAEIESSYRLACQASIEGDAVVSLPVRTRDHSEPIGKTLLSGPYQVDHMIERVTLPPARPPRDVADAADWLAKRTFAAAGRSVVINDPEALRQLSQMEGNGEPVTVVHHRERGVTALVPGIRERSLGVALDIGTTTLACYLCDLKSGMVLRGTASINPQRRYGEDIISRIAFANDHSHGLQTLNEMVVDAVNHLIDRCLEQTDAGHEELDEVAVVGNTTMETILAGFHPRGLGTSPYLPVFRAPLNLKARQLGLKLNPGTNVFLFPVISGFVGGDTVSAILADLICDRDETCLLVDIGTNGEIALGNRRGIWATSCATGPALEGAHISCGMRAVSGAIYKVYIDPTTLRPQCDVLGGDHNVPPLGICGSGIVDAVAEMRRAGILRPNGRFEEGIPGVVTDASGAGRAFVLVPAEKSGTRKPIGITLADMRQFQLAKSALCVGIDLLMRHTGVSRVERTVLTGSFGARFDWKNALTVGMLPRTALEGEVLSRENLAGVGAVLALLDRKQRGHAARIAREARFIELAQDPEFSTRFVEGTMFPPL